MHKLIVVGALAVGMMSAGQALASGGLSCEGSAGKVSFEIQSGVTRGMGSPLFQFQAIVETTDTKIEPDLRKVEMTKDHVAQYWLDGKELKLVLYRERAEGDHGYVELTILTKAKGGDDEGMYAGRFDASYFDVKGDTSGEGKRVELKGKVECFVE